MQFKFNTTSILRLFLGVVVVATSFAFAHPGIDENDLESQGAILVTSFSMPTTEPEVSVPITEGAPEDGEILEDSEINPKENGSAIIMIPRKMTEGGLIRTVFDLGLTILNDGANEAKYLQELRKNGTDLENLIQNETAANATQHEYQKRYNRRYGYDENGYHRHGIMPMFIPMHYGGFGGRGHWYGGGGGYRSAMLMSSMPTIANRMTKKRGFGSSFGYAGYGKHNFAGGAYGTTGGSNGFKGGRGSKYYGSGKKYGFGWNVPSRSSIASAVSRSHSSSGWGGSGWRGGSGRSVFSGRGGGGGRRG